MLMFQRYSTVTTVNRLFSSVVSVCGSLIGGIKIHEGNTYHVSWCQSQIQYRDMFFSSFSTFKSWNYEKDIRHKKKKLNVG